MNFLAHLYLSEPTDDAWLGSLLGDFVKGPLDGRYGEDITRAIVKPTDAIFRIGFYAALCERQKTWRHPRDKTGPVRFARSMWVLSQQYPRVPGRRIVDVKVSFGRLLGGTASQLSIRKVCEQSALTGHIDGPRSTG